MSLRLKPGQTLRRRIRRKRWQAARADWRVVTVILVGYAGLMALFLAYTRWVSPSAVTFSAGAATVGAVWCLKEVVWLLAPETSWSLGARGEELTGEVLRKSRRRGWRDVHGLSFEGDFGTFDVDHVAVGPGGIVAIETKYVGTSTSSEPPFYQAKIRQALHGARKIRLFIRHQCKVEANVVPVLCLWGPGSATLQPVAKKDGVLVVARPGDGRWLDELGQSLDPAPQSAIYAELERYASAQLKARRRIFRDERRRIRAAVRVQG